MSFATQQPIWYQSSGSPPPEIVIPNPFLNYERFLDHMASDISDLLNSRSTLSTLAIDFVRKSKTLHGVGVYTSVEIFAMAGKYCLIAGMK